MTAAVAHRSLNFTVVLGALWLGAGLNALGNAVFLSGSPDALAGMVGYVALSPLFGLPLILTDRLFGRGWSLATLFLIAVPLIYAIAAAAGMLAYVATYSESDTGATRQWGVPILVAATGAVLCFLVLAVMRRSSSFRLAPPTAIAGAVATTAAVAVPLLMARMSSPYFGLDALPLTGAASSVGLPLAWQVAFAVFVAVMISRSDAMTSKMPQDV